MSIMLPESTSPFINRSIRRIKSSVDVLQREAKTHNTSISLLSNSISSLSDITKINENNLIKNNEIINDLVQKFTDSVETYKHIHERYDTELMSLSEDLSNMAIQITTISKEIINIKSDIASLLSDMRLIQGSIDMTITLKYADLREEISKEYLDIKEINNKNRDDINLLKGDVEKCKNMNQKTLDYANRKMNQLEDKIERKCCVIS